MTGYRLGPPVAALAAVALTACGGTAAPSGLIRNPPPVSRSAAVAYLRAHPAPPRDGIDAGIVLNVRATDVPLGSKNPSGTVLAVIMMTAAGEETTTCGNVPASEGCDVPDGGKIANLPGSYLYLRLPSDGRATSASYVRYIKIAAVGP
jgi:hypothetical protein